MTQGHTYDHPDIVRPDYCECETPWQTLDGPLKDGSHYSNCVAAEVAEAMDELRAELAAANAIVPKVRELAELLLRITEDYR